jgi:hypothetical protein
VRCAPAEGGFRRPGKRLSRMIIHRYITDTTDIIADHR